MSIGCSASASKGGQSAASRLCPSAIASSTISRFSWPMTVIRIVRARKDRGPRQGHSVHSVSAPPASRRRRGGPWAHPAPPEGPAPAASPAVPPVVADAEPHEVGRPWEVPAVAHRRRCRQAGSPAAPETIGKTRAPVGRNVWQARGLWTADCRPATSKSSVGMIVTRFHGSFCSATFG